MNASIALHMTAGQNFFVPKIGEALASGCSMGWYWLTALALKIFGWSEFAVRFWSALSGLGMIFASALSARLYENESSRISFLASCICGSMILCFTVSQISSSHAVYSCLTSFAMAGILKSKYDKRFLILSHFCMALSFITHGASGLFLPFIAVIIYSTICDDLKLMKDFFTWPGGIIITILLSGLYFLLLMLINPRIIFFMFCKNHCYSFGGILGSAMFVFMSLTPFHGFILTALYEIFPRKYPAEDSPQLFMFIWSFVFGISAILTGDILSMASMIPAISAILGRKTDSWLKENFSSIRYSVMINTLILIPVLFIFIPLTMRYFPVMRASVMSLIPYEITMGLFVFACWYYTKTRQIKKWIRNISISALICLMPLAGVFNLTAEIYSIREAGLKLRDTIESNEQIIQYGVNYPSIYFYTFRNSILVKTELTPGVQEIRFRAASSIIDELWKKNGKVYLIIPSDSDSQEMPLPKNIYHILEAEGILLLTNKS